MYGWMDGVRRYMLCRGTANPLGKPISMDEEADEHIFGLVLMNDWSAR